MVSLVWSSSFISVWSKYVAWGSSSFFFLIHFFKKFILRDSGSTGGRERIPSGSMLTAAQGGTPSLKPQDHDLSESDAQMTELSRYPKLCPFKYTENGLTTV